MSAESLLGTCRLILVVFPLIPVFGVLVILAAQYGFRRDISLGALRCTIVVQTALAAAIVYCYRGDALIVPVAMWEYSIVFQWDAYRPYFMAAYITPVVFALFAARRLDGTTIRVIFLFYLAGCSGIIVTGDLFNFYVFYEVMIMAAYVLITVNRAYYAGIKYMVIGAVSSALLLAGIILLYASGAYLRFSFVDEIGAYSIDNIKFLALLFSMAFFVKGAFFPVSGWTATCHAATNSVVSGVLSSFTIFTGIFGMYYLVILPAVNAGYTPILEFIRILSVITVLVPSVFLFFEPDLKRCIAGSTVFTVGFVGILLSYQLFAPAFTYMAIHAVYKSTMFHLYDDLLVSGLVVRARRRSIAALFLTVLFTAGFFPSLVYFLKYAFLEINPYYRILVYVSMFFVFGSFFKFKYIVTERKISWSPAVLFFVMLGAYYVVFPFYRSISSTGLTIDLAILTLGIVAARPLYLRLRRLSSFDTKFVYVNLNFELFYIVVLLVVEIVLLRAYLA